MKRLYHFLKYRVLKYRVYRETKFFFQRARWGFSIGDTWNFNNYLARIISKGLVYMKISRPCGLTQKKWDTILNQIIKGFTLYNTIEEEIRDTTPKEQKYIDKAFDLFKEWFGAFWW